MTLAIARVRESLTPALAGSAALHAAFAALLLVSWPWARDLKVGSVVPVRIVTNAETTDLSPAVEAPQPQTAAAPEPAPEAAMQAPAPDPAPPAPAPMAAPPPPKPAPVAEKTPAKPAPAAKAASPAQARPDVDLDKLLASLSKSGRPGGGAPRSAAPKGPARPQTAPQARPAAGTGLSALALTGLSDQLQRRWNPNCDVEGGRDVKLRVTFTLGPSGMVLGEVSAGGAEKSSDPVVQAAAERAIRAVHASAPFRNLPPAFYGDQVKVNFNAAEACS